MDTAAVRIHGKWRLDVVHKRDKTYTLKYTECTTEPFKFETSPGKLTCEFQRCIGCGALYLDAVAEKRLKEKS